ncbi:tryptophan halogenase family protein [Sphingomonas sp. Leaf38]|uniref:tryptophan halogenase family protein n=1 Tax=Sphingomonas sp. Leaf38 TaxID=1736217 RepID=UPI0006FB897B|nr:tryptophan halogenase family protein [Sphingomonas sp. Leaf38]KQN29367.1 tryptophan halogenase [Sphingomonas sp. Leaf38]
MTDRALRSIAIIGGGTAGWMAAAALAHVLGTRNVAITLVESEEIGTVGVGEATIPPIQAFNALLGIDEDAFVAATMGSFKLGIEFVDWLRPGACYFHPFGVYGTDVGAVPFEGLWHRLRAVGDAASLDAYSICAAAAQDGRFMRPLTDGGNTPLHRIGYAYHFDASLYARFLRRHAEATGVVRREGRVVDVAVRGADGFVETVTLASGERIAADLFVDCSGFRALLLGETLGTGYEDWSHWLPNDRAVAVPSAPVGPPTPYTRSTARAAGWQWRIPLQHRTGNGYVFASGHLSEDEAIATLLASLDGEPLAEPRALRFRTGRRDAFWVKNCVGLGLSSGFLEPLESTSIHLIQAGIARLLEMLPTRDFEAADIRRYNRLMIAEYDSIRDFIILHFHATQRDDTPYWDHVRTMAVPETLAERIRIYQATGRVFREADDLFTKTSWLAVMDGQGLCANGFDPLAASLSADEARTRLARMAAVTAAAATRMPPHEQFIARHCARSIA